MKLASETFSSRFSRILDLIYLLMQPQGHTCKTLSEHYGVNRRTMERDLDLLREVHFPLENLGRGKGYRLAAEFRFPARPLNLAETIPLVLGGRLVDGGNLSTALSKLRNFVVNGVERRVVLGLADRVAYTADDRGLQWLEPISVAIVQARKVQVVYQGDRDLAPRNRLLEPKTLFLRHSVWYVLAFDQQSQAERTFRLNRISQCYSAGEVQSTPTGEAWDAAFHPWDLCEGQVMEARLAVSPELAAWLAENPAHPSQQMENQEVRYVIRSTPPFLRWVLSLEGATLLAPPVLLDELKAQIEQLARRYSSV